MEKHYILKCHECDKVINECPCQVVNKTEFIGVCDRCDVIQSTYKIKVDYEITLNAENSDMALNAAKNLNFGALNWEIQDNKIASYKSEVKEVEEVA